MQPWPTTFAAAVRLHAPVDTSACWFHGFEKRQMQSQEPQDDGGLASLLLFHPALTPGTEEREGLVPKEIAAVKILACRLL